MRYVIEKLLTKESREVLTRMKRSKLHRILVRKIAVYSDSVIFETSNQLYEVRNKIEVEKDKDEYFHLAISETSENMNRSNYEAIEIMEEVDEIHMIRDHVTFDNKERGFCWDVIADVGIKIYTSENILTVAAFDSIGGFLEYSWTDILLSDTKENIAKMWEMKTDKLKYFDRAVLKI